MLWRGKQKFTHIESVGVNIGFGGQQSLLGGKTFFVNCNTGSDGKEGISPKDPLATLEVAEAKCRTGKHDFIFVQDFWNLSTESPLLLDKSDLSIIGLGSGNFDMGNDIGALGATVAIQIRNGAHDLELAGFNIGGDGTTYALETPAGHTAYRVHIHHCTFGNNYPCTDGLHMAELSNSTIEHCLFGSAITGYAMNIPGTVMAIIRDNIFHNCDGGCIYLSLGAVQNFILENTFQGVIGSAVGWAIDLPVSSSGSTIMGNRAAEYAGAGGNNPYRDRSANSLAAKLNAWADNKIGNAFGDPQATI